MNVSSNKTVNRFLGKIGESITKPVDIDNQNKKVEILEVYDKNDLDMMVVNIKDSNLKILKLINENNQVVETTDIFIQLDDGKVKTLNNKTLIFECLEETKSIFTHGNKTLFGIKHVLNDNFIIDQIITNRNVVLYLSYIDDEKIITFAKSKNYTMTELNKIINKKIKISITKDVIKYSPDLKLSPKAKDKVLTINYIPQNKFYDSSTYEDIFKTLYEIYKTTNDINYIKLVLNYSREFYDIMLEEL